MGSRITTDFIMMVVINKVFRENPGDMDYFKKKFQGNQKYLNCRL
jgi:hypothetical protein